MKNKKTLICVQIAVIAAGAALCAAFSIPAAIILIAVSAATAALQLISEKRRKMRIMGLCDDIDSILRGSDHVSFDDYGEDELSILTAEIHKMTIRLREQNAAVLSEKSLLKEALEDIAHQLRTPLTSMLLLIENLRAPELTPKERMMYLNELSVLLSRMSWLIDTLLGLSRLEAGAVQMRREEINCRELISAALEPVAISLELKNISVSVEIADEPCFIGDRQYCTEALLNLLKNCMEHTPEGGRISVRAEENPIFTGMTITDSGSGFTPEELPHVFERFYRSGSSDSSGYGIGLAFARRIVTEQNGSLQAKNAPGGGALFDMRIYKTTV